MDPKHPSDIEQTLARCEFFNGLEPNEIRNIAGICRVQIYDMGDLVYPQGQIGECIYIVAEGRVVLERSMNMGTRQGRVVIATLGKGRVFGCWSTLFNQPHVMMLNAFCETSATILVLRGSDLRNLMVQDTRFGFHVMERLCALLGQRIQSAYGALEKI